MKLLYVLGTGVVCGLATMFLFELLLAELDNQGIWHFALGMVPGTVLGQLSVNRMVGRRRRSGRVSRSATLNLLSSICLLAAVALLLLAAIRFVMGHPSNRDLWVILAMAGAAVVALLIGIGVRLHGALRGSSHRPA